MSPPTLSRAARAPIWWLMLALAGPIAGAKPSAPPWLTGIIARPASMSYGSAKAAVLLDEMTLDVDKAGVFTTRTRWVVRILTRDGRKHAVGRVRYNTSADRVTTFEAWLVRPSGEVVPFKKKTAIDIAIFENARELYGDAKEKFITAEDEADAGDVFAYEAVIENNALQAQQVWSFQDDLPMEYSGITVTLPPGWQVTGRMFNHEPVAPIQRGQSTTWEMRALPGIEDEAMSPPSISYRPWLGLEIRPPAGAKTRRVAFASWGDIAGYFGPKYDTAAVPDAALKAKADALVAGAATPWEKVRRLCRYAQGVNYIFIDLNSAEAGGLIPRPAARVLQCNYGDCKEKSTLLRALLRAEGIDSVPLIVSAGGGRYIIPDWPSTSQFNHCILAIRLDPPPDVPAKLVDPRYGSFVLFDPTSEVIPPGWLPESDCDGRVLLLAGSAGDLISIPPARPEDNRLEREITAQIFGDGSIQGAVTEKFQGDPAGKARDEYRHLSPSEFDKAIGRWLGRTMAAARVVHLESKDEFEANRFTLTTQFTAPAYGKPMRNVLLVFKPVIVARRAGTALKKEARHAPVQIEAGSFADHTRIEYPAEFALDELPKPVTLKTAFGTYQATVAAAGDHAVTVERSLELSDATIAAADYEPVRAFFQRIIEAEQAPVVLRRKPAPEIPPAPPRPAATPEPPSAAPSAVSSAESPSKPPAGEALPPPSGGTATAPAAGSPP